MTESGASDHDFGCANPDMSADTGSNAVDLAVPRLNAHVSLGRHGLQRLIGVYAHAYGVCRDVWCHELVCRLCWTKLKTQILTLVSDLHRGNLLVTSIEGKTSCVGVTPCLHLWHVGANNTVTGKAGHTATCALPQG